MHLDAEGESLVDRGNYLKLGRPGGLQKLLDAANGAPCANCNRQDGTVIAAHCNELALGRGFGHKTADWLVAYLCHECHDFHEGRRGNLTREQRQQLWHRAHCVTTDYWFKFGLVKVA